MTGYTVFSVRVFSVRCLSGTVVNGVKHDGVGTAARSKPRKLNKTYPRVWLRMLNCASCLLSIIAPPLRLQKAMEYPQSLVAPEALEAPSFFRVVGRMPLPLPLPLHSSSPPPPSPPWKHYAQAESQRACACVSRHAQRCLCLVHDDTLDEPGILTVSVYVPVYAVGTKRIASSPPNRGCGGSYKLLPNTHTDDGALECWVLRETRECDTVNARNCGSRSIVELGAVYYGRGAQRGRALPLSDALWDCDVRRTMGPWIAEMETTLSLVAFVVDAVNAKAD